MKTRTTRKADPPATLDASAKFAFAPVKPKRVFEEIILQIRRELTLGNLKPGDKLPAERELVKQFGVSRTAVREALRTLENAGIVHFTKGVKGGAFIREADPGLLTRLLGDLVSLGTISVESLTEARLHVLGMVVQLAAHSATEQHLSAMTAAVDLAERYTAEGSDQKRLEAIGIFYEHLALATGNEVLVMLVESITAIVRTVIQEVAPLPKVDTVSNLRNVITAVHDRDAARAGELMRCHLNDLHRYLLMSRKEMSMFQSAQSLSTGFLTIGRQPAPQAPTVLL